MNNRVDVGDVSVAYSLSGSGPPLLLMHGAEGSHHMFEQLTSFLTPHFTVIAYDQRDCGDTQNCQGFSSLADLALDAKGLLLALGFPKTHVYGTSFGGRVAQAFAINHPEMVERLILASTWPLPYGLDHFNGATVREIENLRSHLPETAAALAEYFFPPSYLSTHPHLRDIFKTAPRRSERSQRRSQTVNDQPALDPRALQMPALLIAGELDRVVPHQTTLGMADMIVGAQCVLLAGIGHAGALQGAEQVADHLRRFCIGSPEQVPRFTAPGPRP